MTKLTELEKQKAITCVNYVEIEFRCKRYKLEDEYAELNHYDEELEKKLDHAKEMEEFYSELARKLKEVL